MIKMTLKQVLEEMLPHVDSTCTYVQVRIVDMQEWVDALGAQGQGEAKPAGFGIACTVTWTELFDAMTADGMSPPNKCGPATQKWIKQVVRDYLLCPPASPAGVPDECNAAVEAIQFALHGEEGLAFLRCWNEGNFDACRSEWPEAPASCYIGADPLLHHPIAAQGQGEAVEWQYQGRDGVWRSFISDKHRHDTEADGSWPIRPLYTAQPASPAGVPDAKTEMDYEYDAEGMLDPYHSGHMGGWNDCRKAVLSAAPSAPAIDAPDSKR